MLLNWVNYCFLVLGKRKNSEVNTCFNFRWNFSGGLYRVIMSKPRGKYLCGKSFAGMLQVYAEYLL